MYLRSGCSITLEQDDDMFAFMLENQDTSFVCQKNLFKVPCVVLAFFTLFLQYSLARFLLNGLLVQSSLASIRVCFPAMKANVRFVYPSPPLLNRLFHVALSTNQAYRVSYLYYSFIYTFPFCLHNRNLCFPGRGKTSNLCFQGRAQQNISRIVLSSSPIFGFEFVTDFQFFV